MTLYQETETEIITCPDCGAEIEYKVVNHGRVIEMWVPGACPGCGMCLK